MRGIAATAACAAALSFGTGAAADEARWSVGVPVGVYLFDGNDGGVSVGLSPSRTKLPWRVEAGAEYVANPVSTGYSLRAHGGYARAAGERWTAFALGGYRLLKLEHRDGDDKTLDHVTARAGATYHGKSLELGVGGELGVAFASTETDGTAFYGAFVELGFRVGR